MGAPLLFIGVQQVIGRACTQDQIELPGQVGRVAQPGAHALSEEGRHLVRGVADQEHALVTPVPGHQAVEGVDGGALDLERSAGEPGRDEVADLAGLEHGGRVVAVHQPELEPVAPGGHRDRVGGPSGVAPADGAARFFLGRVQDQVDDQPGFLEVQVFDVEADLVPDPAGRPVARHDPLRGHIQPLAPGRGGRDPDVIAGAGDAGHLRPEPDGYRRHRRNRLADRPVQGRLEEVHAGRQARGTGLVAGDPGQERTVRGEEVQPEVGLHGGQETVEQAQFLPRAQAGVIDVGGPGQRKHLSVPLQHQDVEAAPAEQASQGSTDRTEAHHQHIYRVGSGAHHLPVVASGRRLWTSLI
jgi:hypothetical protein